MRRRVTLPRPLRTGAARRRLRDAQELGRLTEQIERSDSYFRSVIENVSDLITILEADGTIRYISPSVHRILGYEPEERIGRQGFDLVHPDDADHVRGLMAEAISRGRTAALAAYRYRHTDGSWRHLESTGLNMLIDPAVNGIVVTSRDVTARLEIEGRYRSLFQNMLEGFAHCRLLYQDGKPNDWVALEVNRAFETLTGLNDVAGRKASEMLPGLLQQNPELFDAFARVATTGAEERFEAYLPVLHRWFNVSVYGGEPSHFMTVFDDITERKRAEADIRERAEVSALITTVGMALTTDDSLAVALQRCADAVVTNLGAALARIWTLEDVLELQATAGSDAHLDGRFDHVSLDHYKVGRIAQSGQPLVIDDVSKDHEIHEPLAQ